MSIKEQLVKLKENWLIAVVIVVLLGVSMFSGSGGRIGGALYNSYADFAPGGYAMEAMDEMAVAKSSYYRGGAWGGSEFAPEVEERKITKTASLRTEVDRGSFKENEAKMKAIIKSSDGFILNENVYEHGEEKRKYLSGYYNIRVETDKYEFVLSQLKDIGKITSFNENANDVTGSYTNLEVELEVEKERLKRYQEMYNEATEISDKIELNDRIFNQERTIKYYEERLSNIDQRIEYTTVSFSMDEEQSNYANVAIVKFSELVRKIVNSISSLFKLIFIIIPWAIAVLIIGLVIRGVRRKKK